MTGPAVPSKAIPIPPAQGEAPPPPAPDDPPPNTAPLPPQPPMEAPKLTKVQKSSVPNGSAEGTPPGMKAGAEMGYWIWRAGPNVWKLRTTTRDARHVFTGTVVGVKGPVTGIRPVRNEIKDRIVLRGDHVTFQFATTGDFDGFDFTTKDNICVEFNITLDGAPTNKIKLGKNHVQPKTNHFTVCP
jgi:hypothetical protein